MYGIKRKERENRRRKEARAMTTLPTERGTEAGKDGAAGSLTHSLTYLLTHSLTHSCTHACMYTRTFAFSCERVAYIFEYIRARPGSRACVGRGTRASRRPSTSTRSRLFSSADLLTYCLLWLTFNHSIRRGELLRVVGGHAVRG